jgi:hypothetical protein
MQKTSVDLYPERTPASTWLSICASWWLLLKPEMKRRGSNGEAADGKQGTVFLSVPHYWSWETVACSLIPWPLYECNKAVTATMWPQGYWSRELCWTPSVGGAAGLPEVTHTTDYCVLLAFCASLLCQISSAMVAVLYTWKDLFPTQPLPFLNLPDLIHTDLSLRSPLNSPSSQRPLPTMTGLCSPPHTPNLFCTLLSACYNQNYLLKMDISCQVLNSGIPCHFILHLWYLVPCLQTVDD